MKRTWWTVAPVTKRINSFFVYLFCAVASLIFATAIDRILYTTLKEQFESEPTKEDE